MKKQIVLGILTLALGLGLILGEAPLIFAQESDIDEFTLEEITVTAQKRQQELQKVSTSVEVIQGTELTDMGMLDLDDALKYQSSALVQPAGEEMNVSIRGMDNDSMPGDSFSQVAVTVDGSFSASFGVGTTGLYDMERIEVLAGPQGTLYSRNSSGGVVNMISNVPTTEKFEASGSVEVGSKNLMNTQGMVNAPVNDSVALRAAFISTVRDGFADNGLNDADDRSVRLRLGYDPSDELSAVLTYEYTKIGGRSQGNGFAAFEDEDDVADPWHNASDANLFLADNQTDKFYMTMTWESPIGEFTFVPSYSDANIHFQQAGWITVADDGTQGFGAMASGERIGEAAEHFFSPQEELAAELRLASLEDSFMAWMVGLYYYERTWWDKICHDNIYGPNGLVVSDTCGGDFNRITNNPTSAAFGNLTYPVTDTFRLVLGGRFTADKENQTGVAGPPGTVGPMVTDHYESDHFDYRAAVEYDLDENTMVWLDHSTGYKHAARNAASQELMSYQAGIKSRYLDNKLQFNATGFYYDYSNFDIGRGVGSVAWDDPDTGETYTYQGQGIGDAILFGYDISTDWIATNKDRINLALSYLKAEVDEVIITYRYQGMENPEIPPAHVDAGKPLNNAPELTIVAGYEHRFDLDNGGIITPRISTRYMTKYYLSFYVDARNVPEGMDGERVNTEPNSIMTDFSMNYAAPSGKWTLNGYVKNIEDHAQKNGFMRGDLRLGPPRTWGAVLSVRY